MKYFQNENVNIFYNSKKTKKKKPMIKLENISYNIRENKDYI